LINNLLASTSYCNDLSLSHLPRRLSIDPSTALCSYGDLQSSRDQINYSTGMMDDDDDIDGDDDNDYDDIDDAGA
jgi:hypothetical protein